MCVHNKTYLYFNLYNHSMHACTMYAGYDRSLVAGNDYIDAINSEAKSIQRNSMKVNEHSVHDGSKQRLNVEDMLEKLKRLTTHGGQ